MISFLLLLGPRTAERVVHVVIAFVTRVLIDRIVLASLQRERHSPWLRSGLHIFNCELITESVGVRRRKPFHHSKGITRRRVCHWNAGKEIRCLHHECVSLPVTTRLSHPGSNVCVRMRPSIHGDHPRLVNHFISKHDIAWALNDLVSGVVAIRKDGTHQTPGDATVPQTFVFPCIVTADGSRRAGARSSCGRSVCVKFCWFGRLSRWHPVRSIC